MTTAVDLVGLGLPPNPANTLANMINGQAIRIEATTMAYTVTVNDIGVMIIFQAAGAVAVTIPASLPVSLGTRDPRPVVQFCQFGAGAVTVSAGVGVTLNPATATANQYAIIGIIEISSNSWVGFGALA